MKYIKNEKGEMTFFTIFVIIAIVMITSFLMLYASVKINSINIKNGVKMELNNMSAKIYDDTYQSQRESNFSTYLEKLYSDSDYTDMLVNSFIGGLSEKVSLHTKDYKLQNIDLSFSYDDGIRYQFTCDAEFYFSMFGNQYPTVTQKISISGHHNTKF